jgi:hypothetical protein
MSTLRLRLLATLPPAALLLHEGAFAISGGGLRASHGYLELAVPLVAALTASAAAAAIVAPLIARRHDPCQPSRAPLSLAAALVGVFIFQELVEAALLGGGLAGLGAALAAAWALPPLALVLGSCAAAVIAALERTSELILQLALSESGRRRRPPPVSRPRTSEVRGPAIAPLAFGLARRPPPPAVACR